MTELDVILEKLTAQDLRFNNIEAALSDMNKTVQKIAIQDERISHIDSKATKLFKFHDDEFGPDGTISKIQRHQSQCPKEEITNLYAEIKTLRGWFFKLLLTLGVINAGGIAGGILLWVIK